MPGLTKAELVPYYRFGQSSRQKQGHSALPKQAVVTAAERDLDIETEMCIALGR